MQATEQTGDNLDEIPLFSTLRGLWLTNFNVLDKIVYDPWYKKKSFQANRITLTLNFQRCTLLVADWIIKSGFLLKEKVTKQWKSRRMKKWRVTGIEQRIIIFV